MQTVLICLNSAQVIQNVIAILNLKPDRVVVFSTEDVANQFTWLQKALESIGCRVDPADIHLVHPTRFTDIYGQYSSWLQTESKENKRYILNATGGTKPMSFAAIESFRNLPGFSAVYIDSDKDQTLSYFFPGPVEVKTVHAFPSIEIYLAAYGFGLRTTSLPRNEMEKAYDRLWEHVSRHFSPMSWLFTALRRDASSQKELLSRPGMEQGLRRNLQKLQNTGLINGFTENGSSFHVAPADNPSYKDLVLQNGWLEEYMAWTLRKKGMDEVLRGCHIAPPSGSSDFAEFDVVARKGARLYLIECKTGRIQIDQELIHALESKVRMAAGIFAVPIFVISNRQAILSQFQSDRFRHSHIHVIQHDELRNLTLALENILRPFVLSPVRQNSSDRKGPS